MGSQKTYIFGCNGMLGRYMYEYLRESFENIVGISREEYDLTTSLPELRDSDIVINCASINKCNEKNLHSAIAVNSELPHKIRKQCRLIQISTDKVFSGKKGDYSAEDKPDPVDIYGLTKLQGETGCVIRTSIVGVTGGIIKWILTSGTSLNGYTNYFWNGVTCLQLSEFVGGLIRNGFNDGCLHLCSNRVSKFDFIRKVIETFELQKEVIPFSLPEIIDMTLQGERMELDIGGLRKFEKIPAEIDLK